MVMFTGPAGAGKSTPARAWCATRPRAVHVQLDEVRHLIVSGLADPQDAGPLQAEQYGTSMAACCALLRDFVMAGYDVAVDDAVGPEGFEGHWSQRLAGIAFSILVVRPSLEAALVSREEPGDPRLVTRALPKNSNVGPRRCYRKPVGNSTPRACR